MLEGHLVRDKFLNQVGEGEDDDAVWSNPEACQTALETVLRQHVYELNSLPVVKAPYRTSLKTMVCVFEDSSTIAFKY